MLKHFFFVSLCTTPQDPANVRPPSTITGRVRVSFLIRVRVMNAMSRDPLDGPSFESESAANCQEVLDQSRDSVTTMS